MRTHKGQRPGPVASAAAGVQMSGAAEQGEIAEQGGNGSTAVSMLHTRFAHSHTSASGAAPLLSRDTTRSDASITDKSSTAHARPVARAMTAAILCYSDSPWTK